MITAQELREVLSYDPETGVFVWRQTRGKGHEGKLAGTAANRPWRIRLHGKTYAAHRLAWLYVFGEWPARSLDHVNGNPQDNRIDNLRQASHSENMRNRKVHKNNETGLKGVFLDKKTGRYRARIYVGGRIKSLGRFNCPTAAHFAYCKAAKAHFGEFARLK